jgi:hypothetical protein
MRAARPIPEQDPLPVPWTIPPSLDLRTLLVDLEPGAAALVAVGAALLLLLLIALILVLRGRRRRSAAARATRNATAALRRDPGIRRASPSPLFAGRDGPSDVLGSTLKETEDVLGVLRALEAADPAESFEPGPPLPSWLDTEPQLAAEPPPEPEAESEPAPAPAPAPAPEPEPEPEPEPVAAPALTFVRSVEVRTSRGPRTERTSLAPWMVVAGAALFVVARRRRLRRPLT